MNSIKEILLAHQLIDKVEECDKTRWEFMQNMEA